MASIADRLHHMHTSQLASYASQRRPGAPLIPREAFQKRPARERAHLGTRACPSTLGASWSAMHSMCETGPVSIGCRQLRVQTAGHGALPVRGSSAPLGNDSTFALRPQHHWHGCWPASQGGSDSQCTGMGARAFCVAWGRSLVCLPVGLSHQRAERLNNCMPDTRQVQSAIRA